MGSPMSHPNMCCVCFEEITPGDHAVFEGDTWDAHAGMCAYAAGIGPRPLQDPTHRKVDA